MFYLLRLARKIVFEMKCGRRISCTASFGLIGDFENGSLGCQHQFDLEFHTPATLARVRTKNDDAKGRDGNREVVIEGQRSIGKLADWRRLALKKMGFSRSPGNLLSR